MELAAGKPPAPAGWKAHPTKKPRAAKKVKIVLAIFRMVYILVIVDGGWLMVERAAGAGGWKGRRAPTRAALAAGVVL